MTNAPGEHHQIVWPGSVPQELGTEDAMQLLADRVGPFLRWLPWETDPDWIIRWLKLLADHPDIEIAREGKWTGYDDMTRYRIRKGHELHEEFIQVGIIDAWSHYADYQSLRRALPTGIPMQIGIKSPFDFALFAFGQEKILNYNKYVKPFVDAAIREMHTVTAAATTLGIHIGFQLEFPAELIGEVMLPAPLRPAATGLLVRSLIDVVRQAPGNCRIGGHTCPGRWYNIPKVQPKSTAPLMAVINGVVSRWPSNVPPLDYMNLPLGAGCYPPSMDPHFYRPLAGLRVPETTLLVAGILHEKLAVDDAEVLLEVVGNYVRIARGHAAPPLAIGPTCGSGQLSESDFEHILDTGAALCTSHVA